MKRGGLGVVAAAWLGLSCGGPTAQPVVPRVADAVVPSASASASTRTSAPTASAAPAPRAKPPLPRLLYTGTETLAELERRGFALADFFAGNGTGRLSNARLRQNMAFISIMQVVARDIEGVAGRDPDAGVKVSRYSHRLFDTRWLETEQAHFELIGVVNRFDRAPFAADSCGEVRLVYRLAYATTVKETPVTSRLPMTLGIEITLPKTNGDCASAMARWAPPEGTAGATLAAWLVSSAGPLAPAALGMPKPRHRVVVNAQQVRWPSAVRPDLGGHAEYLLRSFVPAGDHYEPEPLENTPDVARLTRDPKLKAELVTWLMEEGNLKATDVGTPFLPAKFLAKRAESVTPRGLGRLSNRPFRQVLAPSDFARVDFTRFGTLKSAEGLIRRLDELTCPGCHQARSIAGFHLLGDDPADTPAGNAVALGSSPHLTSDLRRREAVASTLLAGASPDLAQPFPERSSFDGYGAHCGLGNDPTFAAWTCGAGLTCQAYDAPAGDGVGQCLHAVPRAAGDPCEFGPVKPNANSHRDRTSGVTRSDCLGNAVCNANSVGFPGGMCTETCSALSPSSACGAIAVLEPFNACVARGVPFQDCLKDHVRPAGLRACDTATPCRDDYICAKGAAGSTCIPPYFLFQLRVDGHP